MTSIAILQSNYLPWKGYFDLIAAVDTFVVYDTVQYTKNDWRNRNKIKAPEGTRWLTLPVRRESSSMRIDEARVMDPEILRKHYMTIKQVYGKAPGFGAMQDRLEPLFDRTAPERLSDLNAGFICRICDLLEISTEIVDSSKYDLSGDRNQRLVDICQQAGADTYLSGPAARGYLDEALFTDAGIRVEWMSYDGYPTYDQPFPPFNHNVSVIDLLLCTGENAPAHLLNGTGSR